MVQGIEHCINKHKAQSWKYQYWQKMSKMWYIGSIFTE
jgi:hypothetical protein